MHKIVREKKSRAVLNNDSSALERYKTARKRLREKDTTITDLAARIERLEKLLEKIS